MDAVKDPMAFAEVDPAIVGRFRAVAAGCVTVGMAISGLAFCGWLFHVVALRDLFSHAGLAGAIAPTTAVAVWLLGMGLAWRLRGANRWSAGVGIFVAVWAIAKSIQFWAGGSASPDPEFLALLGWPGVVDYMAPNAAIALAFLGVSLAVMSLGRSETSYRTANVLATVGGSIGLFAVLGFVLSVPTLLYVGGREEPTLFIALPAAISFFAYGVALLMADTARGFMRVFAGTESSGLFARRLIPVLVLLPNVLSWLGEWAMSHGWIGHRGAVLWLVCSLTVVVCMIMVKAILDMDRLERSRRAKANDLAETNVRLNRAKQALESANRELEAFSYSVSHDLRSPLRNIDGFGAMLADEYSDRLDDRGREYLGRVRAGCQRMGRLIDDLLDLSRVTRGETKCTNVDLVLLARETIASLEANEAGRHVDWLLPQRMAVIGDEGLLRIVMGNLLGNAWKFTRGRDPAKIELGTMTTEKGETYFVRDNGAGFDMAYAAKLFSAFQRLHSHNQFEGTGIGLALVQRIVHRHGGQVWAHAEPDQGATIFFTLPQNGHFCDVV